MIWSFNHINQIVSVIFMLLKWAHQSRCHQAIWSEMWSAQFTAQVEPTWATSVCVWEAFFSRTSKAGSSGCVNDLCSCMYEIVETNFIQQSAHRMTSCTSNPSPPQWPHSHAFFSSSLVTHLQPLSFPVTFHLDLHRDNYTPLPSPPRTS